MRIEDLIRAMRCDPNPLETIGLSPTILDLGLSPDALYAYCKKVAQVLFAHMHPDRQDGTAGPQVLAVSDAFARLKDRDAFESALRQFRAAHRDAASMRVCAEQLADRVTYLERENRALKKRLKVQH